MLRSSLKYPPKRSKHLTKGLDSRPRAQKPYVISKFMYKKGITYVFSTMPSPCAQWYWDPRLRGCMWSTHRLPLLQTHWWPTGGTCWRSLPRPRTLGTRYDHRGKKNSGSIFQAKKYTFFHVLESIVSFLHGVCLSPFQNLTWTLLIGKKGDPLLTGPKETKGN